MSMSLIIQYRIFGDRQHAERWRAADIQPVANPYVRGQLGAHYYWLVAT